MRTESAGSAGIGERERERDRRPLVAAVKRRRHERGFPCAFNAYFVFCMSTAVSSPAVCGGGGGGDWFQNPPARRLVCGSTFHDDA
jgi:hypothetical protein